MIEILFYHSNFQRIATENIFQDNMFKVYSLVTIGYLKMKFRTNSTVHSINFAYSHSQYVCIEYLFRYKYSTKERNVFFKRFLRLIASWPIDMKECNFERLFLTWKGELQPEMYCSRPDVKFSAQFFDVDGKTVAIFLQEEGASR